MHLCSAGLFPNLWQHRIAKEYTEYSAQELAALLAAQQPAPGRGSDDFRPGEACGDEVGMCGDSAMVKPLPPVPICKELTEFSEMERALITLNAAPPVRRDDEAEEIGLALKRQTSDDFFCSTASDASDSDREPSEEAEEGPGGRCCAPPTPFGVLFCKEHTEYSQQELENLTAGLVPAPCRTSDCFCASQDSPAAPCQTRCSGPAPLCKELTEYSAKELSLLVDESTAKEGEQQSSDDFLQPAHTFASSYHRNCMKSTGDSVQKRIRRVYHNRRKTAWTDYEEEEDGKLAAKVEASASAAPGVEAAAAEPAEPPLLVRMLKSPDALPATISRESVKEVAQGEAKSRTMTMAAVLKEVGPCGWSPLLIAVQRKQAGAVAALLELGAEVESKEPSCGWTPLMYAAASGRKDVVKQLLAKGASVNVHSPKHNWSPLCSAIQSGNEEVVHVLLAAGADLQAVKKQHPAIADIYRQEMAQFQAPKRPEPKKQAGTNLYRTDYSLSC